MADTGFTKRGVETRDTKCGGGGVAVHLRPDTKSGGGGGGEGCAVHLRPNTKSRGGGGYLAEEEAVPYMKGGLQPPPPPPPPWIRLWFDVSDSI